MVERKFYWAYGSNLNVEAMRARCPQAKKVGPLVLDYSMLVFRSCADVIHDKHSHTPGGLWHITERCERALDLYEGVRSGLYRKVYITLGVDGERHKCLVYQMRDRGIVPPSEGYFNTIAQGYRDFGLDLNYLDAALEYSWSKKKFTPLLRTRRKRHGDYPLFKLDRTNGHMAQE